MRSDLPSHVPVILRAVDAYDLLLGTGLWLHVGTGRQGHLPYVMELQEEEEEEGKAGCFLLLPPLTGQRSTCTYLPDLAYILENVRLSIPATKAERGRNSQLVNYMVTHRHHLFSMHTSYPRAKSLIIPNINFLPIFPQRPEPSQASKKPSIRLPEI